MRAERGIALVTVIVLLVGLLLVATPFALSMRHLESGSLAALDETRALAGAELALAAARRQLQDSHPWYDLDSPFRDDLPELVPPDLAERWPDLLPRDPRGDVRSVAIQDESGKVHLDSASPYLLGNLLGGRSALVADVDEHAQELPLAGTRGFPATGIAWVGHELVEYSDLAADALLLCRRGLPSANLALSRPAAHRAGDEVLDLRLLLLAQHGWRIRPGIFDVFRRVEGLADIGLFGELSYGATEIEAARALLTVHGLPPQWVDPQRVLGSRTRDDGATVLVVRDGRAFGPGTRIELAGADGAREWNLVEEVVPWGSTWHLVLLEPPAREPAAGRAVLRRLLRTPVNVNTCAPRVLVALVEGLGRRPVADVVTEEEAIALGESLAGLPLEAAASELQQVLQPQLQAGAFSLLDLTAAALALEAADLAPDRLAADELAAAVVGAEARRTPQRIPKSRAEGLASRLRAARPGSHEELRAVLDLAVLEGAATALDRDLVLRCAVDAGDAELVGGTAPFAYASAGTFTLLGAASINLPLGKEVGRAFVRQIESIAPPGPTGQELSSQRHFEESFARGPGARGWTSLPRLLRSGPGAGRPPTWDELSRLAGGERPADAAIVDVVAAVSSTLALGEEGVDRAGTLLGGRAGADESEDRGALCPEPVRSQLPGTLHFDEGVSGLTGAGPLGFDFAQGSVALSIPGLVPPLVDGTGLLQPFALEFWFELEDVDAETILFDAGAGELEDRILVALVERTLVLRVHDTSIPDFEAQMPEGRAPPCGEIRYAFDDGLPLLPHVPYHVAAWIGGASDRQLALFVDGVSRGRRSLMTTLIVDLPAGGTVGENVASYGGSKLEVASTAGFPRQGALRVGDEVIEYTELEPDAFVLRAAGSEDPFGGRARRGTPAREHVVSEAVELMGYSLPVASSRLAQGNAVLGSQLDRFGIAELDPTQLSDAIELEVSATGAYAPTLPATIPLGTGLSATATEIPVRATGSVPLTPGTFQADGGHALLVCTYEGLIGEPLSVTIGGVTLIGTFPETTLNGRLGGAECIRYSGFDGGRLTGVTRNALGIPQSTGSAASDLQNANQGRGTWADAREFVTTFAADITGGYAWLGDEPRVLVVPISVELPAGNLWEDFHPAPDGSAGDRPGLLQLGRDFGSGDDVTEWVRWNTATAEALVRDDLAAVDATIAVLDQRDVWNVPDGTLPDQGFVDGLGDELEFRAQDGTPDRNHSAGQPALPVHVLGGWYASFDAITGLPGRQDAVTFVDPEGELREWHRINAAALDDEDWGGYALVGLRDAVTGEFVRTDWLDEENYAIEGLPLDVLFPDDSPERDSVIALNADLRRVTRMLKAPSPELPSAPLAQASLGQDWSGRRSPGAALVDELRFHRPHTPGPLLPPSARYQLADDLPYDEEQELQLRVDRLLYPQGQRFDPLLGPDALAALGQLPPAGGLLLVGEEIVAYAGLDAVDTGKVFVVARALYGTLRAEHRRDAPVTPLLFWPAAPLAAALDELDAAVPVADRTGFPPGGGLLLVDGELIGYDAIDEDGRLTMPPRPGTSRLQAEGLLRGRFGTEPARHATGTLVRWMPQRHADLALLGQDVPESERAVLAVQAPGAFFTEAVLGVAVPDPLVRLDVRAVLDARGAPLAAATAGAGEQLVPLSLGRSADHLEVWLLAGWEPGAFDAQHFASNAWKLAPRVLSLTLGHVQPCLVYEHEEWR